MRCACLSPTQLHFPTKKGAEVGLRATWRGDGARTPGLVAGRAMGRAVRFSAHGLDAWIARTGE